MNAHHPPATSMTTSPSHANNTSVTAPSSRTTTSKGDQNWRGKYLRALNICAPEIDSLPREKRDNASSLKPRSCRADGESQHGSLSRSYSSSTENDDRMMKMKGLHKTRSSAQILSSSKRSHMMGTSVNHNTMAGNGGSSVMNPYGFALRPALSRGRRCHTDPFVLEERVSAPIQIPTASESAHDGETRIFTTGSTTTTTTTTTSTTKLHHRRRRSNSPDNHHAVRLLSWEEPLAMMAAANAVAAGLPLDDSNSTTLGIADTTKKMHTLSSHLYRDVLAESDEDEEDDDDDNDDCAIFEMEELDDSDESTTTSSSRSSSESNAHAFVDSIQPPRRRRTVSASVAQTIPQRQIVHRLSSKDDMQELPASFVPPHQMVERDCFSLGLQNEFKRRPVRI